MVDSMILGQVGAKHFLYFLSFRIARSDLKLVCLKFGGTSTPGRMWHFVNTQLNVPDGKLLLLQVFVLADYQLIRYI